MDPSLLLICSVAREAEPLLELLGRSRPRTIGRKESFDGELAGRSVLLLIGGMGKTNAAQALTAAIEATRRPPGVIGFGVGGAYPGGGARVGGLALATREIYGDEGVAAPAGWIGTDGIGIPLLTQPGGGEIFNDFPLDSPRVTRAERALADAGMEPTAGPFVTLSCCSGTADAGRRLYERFGAVCETMEGAAYAHVSTLYAAPFLEVRGISNRVEDRDLSGWRLDEAARIAARAAAVLVEKWEG